MSWDGKRAERPPTMGFVCAGCLKPGGTLQRVGPKGSPLIHRQCMQRFLNRVREANARAREAAEVTA